MTRKNRDLTKFGKAVRAKAIKKNITLIEVARKTGISPEYLSYILHGHRKGERYIGKIAEVLGIDIDKYTA